MDKLTVLANLHQILGEQKIDLAIYPDLSSPFARLAMASGVPMNTDKLLLLQEGLAHLEQAASHLALSHDRTLAIIRQENWTPEELERLESLSSRFARLSDLLTQKIMRLIDELELTPDGTLLDRIQRAETRLG